MYRILVSAMTYDDGKSGISDYINNVVAQLACGAPVACSNGSSLSEIGGEAVVTFDPGSIADISRGVLRLLKDKELRTTLVEKGYEQIGKFSWSDHARRIVEQYEKDNRTNCRAGKPAA